jgi:hypothetical protein
VKNLFIIALIAFLSIGLVGCEDDDCVGCDAYDPAPATPQGVYSVTGDEAVYIYFNGIYDRDVEEYWVYFSFDPVDDYEVIAVVPARSNPDLDLLIYEYIDTDVANGTTYHYAVAAVDYAGQVSELSAEAVFDTPRPEGLVTLFPNSLQQSLSGFNLETQTVVYDTSSIADIFIDSVGGIHYINVTDDLIDIQDLGYTSDFDEIGWAPEYGWSELGWIELIPEHTYVIWTADDHFAKMRLLGINPSGSVAFQWAYQPSTTDEGKFELAPPVDPEKPDHGTDYLTRDKPFSLLK